MNTQQLSPVPSVQQNTSASDAAWKRYDQARTRVYKDSDHSPRAQEELRVATIHLQAAIAGAVKK